MNIQALMKQAQSMQKDMMKSKEEIDNTIFTGNSALVDVEVAGDKKILKVNINKKEEFELDDLDALEDMLVLALNDAFAKIDKMTEEKMGKYANAMPGLF